MEVAHSSLTACLVLLMFKVALCIAVLVSFFFVLFLFPSDQAMVQGDKYSESVLIGILPLSATQPQILFLDKILEILYDLQESMTC